MPKTKDIFDYFSEPSTQKPKSYNLPLFHAVAFIRDSDSPFFTDGDSLAEAMEPHGGMSALYALRNDPENSQAFKDLYNDKVKSLKFGDDDYGFLIFKDDVAKAVLDDDWFSNNESIPPSLSARKAICRESPFLDCG
jgi:hypothetical protein